MIFKPQILSLAFMTLFLHAAAMPSGRCPPDPSASGPVYLHDSEDCNVFYECDPDGTPAALRSPPDVYPQITDGGTTISYGPDCLI